MRTGRATQRQSAHAGWRRVGQSLTRELSFRDFDEAFAFVERVAHEAVDYLRRPDICIFAFNRVRLTIANAHHSSLTEAELRLARKVDAIISARAAPQRVAPFSAPRRPWAAPQPPLSGTRPMAVR